MVLAELVDPAVAGATRAADPVTVRMVKMSKTVFLYSKRCLFHKRLQSEMFLC